MGGWEDVSPEETTTTYDKHRSSRRRKGTSRRGLEDGRDSRAYESLSRAGLGLRVGLKKVGKGGI